MLSHALACLALASATLVGCKREAAQGADLLIPAPPSTSWLAAQQTAGSPPSPLDGWVLAGGGAAIGSGCSGGGDGHGQSQAVHFDDDDCGLSRRRSIEHRRSALLPGEFVPCEWRRMPSAESQGSFCVSGDHVVVAAACYMCRMMNAGAVMHGKLSDLTPSQHAWLSGMLGFQQGTGPASPEAWRALAAASPPIAR